MPARHDPAAVRELGGSAEGADVGLWSQAGLTLAQRYGKGPPETDRQAFDVMGHLPTLLPTGVIPASHSRRAAPLVAGMTERGGWRGPTSATRHLHASALVTVRPDLPLLRT